MVAVPRCGRLLEEELPGTQVLVVSNREPYIHNYKNGDIALQIPASGLVAAVEPVMRACGGTWIAHGSGSADKETVDANHRLPVPPSDPAYLLRRVWLSEDEQDGYYYGFANEGLWPLCHIAFIRPTFRESDWQHYVVVNERFADAVVQEATQDDPIVLIQDYHFALLPRMVRTRLPKATIVTFWHIPWPNSETFSICPWREEIIDGLLGSHHPRLPHPVSLQQFPRGSRPVHGKPHRPGTRLGDVARDGDSDPRLSDLDRVAANGTRLAGAGGAVPRGRARALLAAA